MSIKTMPKDFIVQELPHPSFNISPTPGPFAVFELTKSSIDTPTACKLLARKLKLPPPAVVPAGLKDKHAWTLQLVSVRLPKDPGFHLPEKAWDQNWSAQRLGYADHEIDSGAILANRFTITVRKLNRRTAQEMEARAQVLRVDTPAGPALRFINYFGAQRFGTNRHHQGFAARQFCLGNPEEALKLLIATPSRKDARLLKDFKTKLQRDWGNWDKALQGLPTIPERAAVEWLQKHPTDFTQAFSKLPYFIQQINVEAYQSYLWNLTACMLITRECPGEPLSGDDEYTPMLFPHAANTPPHLVGMDLPLLAPDTPLVPPWGKLAGHILQKESLKQDQLKVPGLRRPFFGQAPRSLTVDALNVILGHVHADETSSQPDKKEFKRTVTFDLPRGAYATVLLRALGQ
jgi:tRNA pseudouridine13 synthase